jgi:glyceraldehyde 3-phosphate dehydrogenase
MNDKKIKVAINGFGRIGRAFLRLAYSNYQNEIDIVAINDLGDINNLAYLLTYDTGQGASGLEVKASPDGTHLFVNGNDIAMYQEKEPNLIPWGRHDVDIVVESTGFFDDFGKARAHLDAGAKKVVISAPAKGVAEGASSGTVILGINDDQLANIQISSNGSCTTNATSPVIAIINETIGIEKAILNTTHAYTATQSLVDSPVKGGSDYRRGRAAAQNIVPSTTGAAIAVTKVIPDLVGKFDGLALRVPVVSGSIADITFVTKRPTTKEEINEILTQSSLSDRWKGILGVSNEQLVSSDIVGNTHSSIVDLEMTLVVDGNLVKVLAWYDNEMGYTNTLVQHVVRTARSIS